MDKGVVYSPVRKEGTKIRQGDPDSRKDYEVQRQRGTHGFKPMWNDSPTNQSVVGDYFVFVHNRDHVEIHRIDGVGSVVEAYPEWLPTSTPRNTLFLSSEYHVMDWNMWVELGGPSMVLGTKRMTHTTRLSTYLENVTI
jgi:hypothetical protein